MKKDQTYFVSSKQGIPDSKKDLYQCEKSATGFHGDPTSENFCPDCGEDLTPMLEDIEIQREKNYNPFSQPF